MIITFVTTVSNICFINQVSNEKISLFVLFMKLSLKKWSFKTCCQINKIRNFTVFPILSHWNTLIFNIFMAISIGLYCICRLYVWINAMPMQSMVFQSIRTWHSRAPTCMVYSIEHDCLWSFVRSMSSYTKCLDR